MPALLAPLKTSHRLALGSGAVFTGAAAMLQLGAPDLARFLVSGLALAALAALVGQSIEQVGERLGPGPTGLIQSCLGNLPELFVGIFALRAGLVQVVQAALVGSVLGNVLLVLGAAFVTGAARHGTQAFDPVAPRMLVTLMTLAVGAMVLPTLAVRLSPSASHHVTALSDVTAGVLLAVYLCSIPFWLSGGPSPSAPRRQAQWPVGLAVGLLVAAGLGSAFVSDWFVSALTPATRSLGLSPAFTGLVVVAIAANAVENTAGVRFAWKARPDYAISTILNSPLQIALFLTPVLVLTSSVSGFAPLPMVFPLILVVALSVAVVVVGVVLYDGEYSWLEGIALMALYLVIATSIWWGV